MTTVIFKDGTIFSDSKGIEAIKGETIYTAKYDKSRTVYSNVKKVYKDNGIIYAFSGLKSDKAINHIRRWFLANGLHKFLLSWITYPLSAIIWDGKTLFLVDSKKTNFFNRNRWELTSVYKPKKCDAWIMGSGTFHAREAINKGKSVCEAINYAAKHDYGTNNIIQSETVECKY